jgi:hypothetical protein
MAVISDAGILGMAVTSVILLIALAQIPLKYHREGYDIWKIIKYGEFEQR